MEKFDFYKNRLESAAQDGIVEYRQGDKKASECFDELVRGPGKYKRLVAALSLISEIVPKNLHRKLAEALDTKDFSDLPFDLDRFAAREKFAQGYISKVYLLESKTDEYSSYALKINNYDKGDADELARIAADEHREYEYLRARYRELPDLIPEELGFIVRSRKDKKPSIAVVQEFMGRDLRDLFKDIDKDELIALTEENREFREELVKFIDITGALASGREEIIDLIGEKNLVVAEAGGRPVLRFLDPHNITRTPSEMPDRDRRLKQALRYLAMIKEKIENFEEDERLAA